MRVTLRCKSQAMVAKEIAVCLLAYNLVRAAMAQAAALKDVLPRSLSFSGAKRLLAAFADQWRQTTANQRSAVAACALSAIAACGLRYRPHRIEPRAKKRRPKNLPLLSVPRNVARDQIRAQWIIRVT